MSNKRFVIGIGIFCTIVVVGAGYLFFGSKSNAPVSGEKPRGEETKSTEKPIGSSVASLQLPSHYSVFVDNAPDMRAEFKKASKEKFSETLEIIKEHPDSLWAWLDLGSIKKSFNDFDGAEEAWVYATKIYPEHTVAYANLGQLYWHNKVNYPIAEAMFLKVISLNITAVATYRDLADLYRYNYTAKKDQVDDLILSGLKDNPAEPDLLSYLALYYYEIGERDNSIRMYERLVQATPGNKQAQEDLEDLKAGRNIGAPR